MQSANFILALIVLTFSLYGCGAPPAANPSAPDNSAATTEPDAEHANHAHGDHAGHAQSGPASKSDMDKIKSELAKLPPEDRASAEKQHVCPVSGEMLGLMGAPMKIDVKGRQVWICCESCKDPLLENPDKYLAKLNN